MRARTWVVLFTSGLAVTSFSTADAQLRGSPTRNALRFFEGFPSDADAILRALRPPHITAEERARALEVLPETGEVQPDDHERAKLAMLDTVFAYHDRAGVFQTRVIDTPQAVVGLYQRAVLLISRSAARLLSGPELQAMVAHEIGHEFFWAEFEQTRARGDRQGRQELELKCDGIAMLTLVAIGLDPARLRDGLRKQMQFNERVGAVANADEYPQLKERERFMSALRDLLLIRRTTPAVTVRVER